MNLHNIAMVASFVCGLVALTGLSPKSGELMSFGVLPAILAVALH